MLQLSDLQTSATRRQPSGHSPVLYKESIGWILSAVAHTVYWYCNFAMSGLRSRNELGIHVTIDCWG